MNQLFWIGLALLALPPAGLRADDSVERAAQFFRTSGAKVVRDEL